MSQEFTIGRDDAGLADILLSGSTISGLHAKIGIDSSGRLWIKDTDSRNGTELVSREARRTIGSSLEYVNNGDSLAFGGVEYSVDRLLAMLPQTPTPQPDNRNDSTQAVIRCTQCGSVTFPGRPCIKCGR